VDYAQNMTIVAVTGEPGFEKVIAMGCYFLKEKENLAEVAYSADKEWQGKGISSIIQEKLAKAARHHGIGGLMAYTIPDNRRMIRLFKKLPYRIEEGYDGSALVLTAHFDEPREVRRIRPRHRPQRARVAAAHGPLATQSFDITKK
jgi:RimJ/RimL family protein N-acetyltransferase